MVDPPNPFFEQNAIFSLYNIKCHVFLCVWYLSHFLCTSYFSWCSGLTKGNLLHGPYRHTRAKLLAFFKISRGYAWKMTPFSCSREFVPLTWLKKYQLPIFLAKMDTYEYGCNTLVGGCGTGLHLSVVSCANFVAIMHINYLNLKKAAKFNGEIVSEMDPIHQSDQPAPFH